MSSLPAQAYHTDHSQRHLRYSLILCLAISLVFVVFRVLVRTYIQRQFALDDWLLVLATCSFSLMTGFIVYAIDAGGFGKLTEMIPLDVLLRGSKYLVFSQLCYVWTLSVTNLSVAILQLRISGGVYITFKRLHYASMVLSVGVGLGQFLALLLRCYPASKAWTPSMTGGNCADESAIAVGGYVFCAFNIALNWYYALAPIHLIWKLQLRLGEKLSSIFVLSIGVLSSIAQIMKLKYLLAFATASNPLRAFVPLAVVCWIELSLSISAASISTFRPLLRFIPGCLSERVPTYSPTTGLDPPKRLRRGYTFQLSEIDSMNTKLEEFRRAETFELEYPSPTAVTTPRLVEETGRLDYFMTENTPGVGDTRARPIMDLEKGL